MINLFANDSQRLYDVCSLGPLIFGGPVVAIIATAYTVYLLGPHALFGMLVFILYYPVQYGVSLLTGTNRLPLSFKFQHTFYNSSQSRVLSSTNDHRHRQACHAYERTVNVRQTYQNVCLGKAFLENNCRYDKRIVLVLAQVKFLKCRSLYLTSGTNRYS